MNEKDIKRFLDIRIKIQKKALKETHRAISQLEKGEWFYRTNLRSCWADYGEESVTYDGKYGDSLEKVIEDGENKFKEVNNRSDVQAFRLAFVVFKNGENIMIDYPEKKKETNGN